MTTNIDPTRCDCWNNGWSASADTERKAWVCDLCGHAAPMTDRELDWCREDVPKCHRCQHSEEWGGALVWVERWPWKIRQLAHEVPCL